MLSYRGGKWLMFVNVLTKTCGSSKIFQVWPSCYYSAWEGFSQYNLALGDQVLTHYFRNAKVGRHGCALSLSLNTQYGVQSNLSNLWLRRTTLFLSLLWRTGSTFRRELDNEWTGWRLNKLTVVQYLQT